MDRLYEVYAVKLHRETGERETCKTGFGRIGFRSPTERAAHALPGVPGGRLVHFLLAHGFRGRSGRTPPRPIPPRGALRKKVATALRRQTVLHGSELLRREQEAVAVGPGRFAQPTGGTGRLASTPGQWVLAPARRETPDGDARLLRLRPFHWP